MYQVRPPEIEALRNEFRQISERRYKAGRHQEIPPSGPDSELLRIKTADKWLETEYSKPAARRLFGDLWFENELCILFADTNMGKSVLAVQIGHSLAKNSSVTPFDNQMNETANVLYIDFELTTQQFAARYSDRLWGNLHFGEHFFRAEFNPAANDPILYNDYHKFLFESIEHCLRKTKATILIIDNLTCLGTETGNAAGARKLIQSIRTLKTKHKLSVLALAHTPKRNPFKPITVNDLQGSKMLINFCDSAFAIGQSHSLPGACYIKQVKQRTGAEVYGEANICLGRIVKRDFNQLAFEFDSYAHERDHLQKPAFTTQELESKVGELSAKGFSCRQIAEQTGTGRSTVHRILQRMKEGE